MHSNCYPWGAYYERAKCIGEKNLLRLGRNNQKEILYGLELGETEP